MSFSLERMLKADAASISIYIEIKSPMLIVRYVHMQCDLILYAVVASPMCLAQLTSSTSHFYLSRISKLHICYMDFFAMNLFPSRLSSLRCV
jgi:hypothetical protein